MPNQVIIEGCFVSNVDQQEIDKFSEIASRWWDEEGEFKPLHLINPLRLSFIQEYVNGVNGLSILDVGCGGGLVAEGLAKAGATVTGIDMAPASLEVARLHGLETGIKVNYQCIAAESLADAQPESFDVITCLEMLEHVPDPEAIVRACAKLVKPGGTVFFSTLNRNPKSYLFSILGAEYILGWVPKGTHEYEKYIKPSELIGMCDRSELTTKDATGLHYHPLKQAFYLSDDNIDVNYMIVCQK